MEFVETRLFSRLLRGYLTDEEYGNRMNRPKRNLAQELLEGIVDMTAEREGRITLRRFKIPKPARLDLDGTAITKIRDTLRVSRTVFARQLRINERTLEKWEQGGARPNAQAAALILLASRHPETLVWLADLDHDPRAHQSPR